MTGSIEVAKALLKTEAVKLNVQVPFTFVSGIKSPIYCDNRKMIGFPEERKIIVKEFINKIKELEKSGIKFDIIAGTATAGIPWSAFIAMELNLPMAYIRGEKKAHGAGRQIEGAEFSGKKVLVIEDLISTGGSSIKAVEVAKESGATYVEVVAIFSYEFKKAYEGFLNANIKWSALSNFEILLGVAKENKYITAAEENIASSWNKAPEKYGVEI
ncbi:MAG: orotate phosphoribosyltransferase [Fusobacteriaceae bacterium]